MWECGRTPSSTGLQGEGSCAGRALPTGYTPSSEARQPQGRLRRNSALAHHPGSEGFEHLQSHGHSSRSQVTHCKARSRLGENRALDLGVDVDRGLFTKPGAFRR